MFTNWLNDSLALRAWVEKTIYRMETHWLYVKEKVPDTVASKEGHAYSVLWNHHHHIVLAARISLTLSRHSSLSFIALGRSSGQQPVSSHSCWMYVRAGRPAFARPCVGIHKSTSLMSSNPTDFFEKVTTVNNVGCSQILTENPPYC